jgi:hypothetical protein
VRLVSGLVPGVAPAADSKPGRRARARTTAAVTPEKGVKVNAAPRWVADVLAAFGVLVHVALGAVGEQPAADDSVASIRSQVHRINWKRTS